MKTDRVLLLFFSSVQFRVDTAENKLAALRLVERVVTCWQRIDVNRCSGLKALLVISGV